MPVLKSGKDPKQTDSYRGITITPVISKILEHIILSRINFSQDDLQCAFTKGKSPLLAALLVTELVMDSAKDSAPLLLTALDVRKAFDIVDHETPKFRLLQVVRDPTLWKVTVDLLTNSEAKVKANSVHLSQSYKGWAKVASCHL